MKKLIFAACVALGLVACGGGGGASSDTTSSATGSAQVLKAKPAVADPTLVGTDVSVVNTTTAGDQYLVDIGALADGGYTVAWFGTFFQRYDSAGAKVGPEVSVPAQGATAVLSDGGIVVANLSVNVDLHRSVILVRRFDAAGSLIAQAEAAIEIYPPPATGQLGSDVRVAALADGGFLVGWPVIRSTPGGGETQIFIQRYDSQAAPVGDRMQIVGNLSGGAFLAPAPFSIAPDAEGGFTVSVAVAGVSALTRAVVHFDANGTSTQIVGPRPGSVLLLPLQGDRFVLFTSDSSGTVRQFLDSAGNPVGDPVAIAAMPFDAKELADGSFVVLWYTGGNVTAQRFDSTGAPMGDLLTLGASGAQPVGGFAARIAALPDGAFAAAWSAPGAAGDLDVFTQRFIEVFTNDKPAQRQQRKACLADAKGLRGQERRAFMDACMQSAVAVP